MSKLEPATSFRNKNEGGLRFHGKKKVSTSDLPLVSVVTVVRNMKGGLKETSVSTLAQDYPNIEWIVVDGGSTDGTVQFLQELDSQIDYWVSEKDNGFYDALNKALRLAGGDIVNVLNAEDHYVDSRVISRIVDLWKKSNVDMVVTDTLMMNKSLGYGWVRRSTLSRAYLASGGIPQQSFFYARKLFEKIGDFNTEYKIISDFEWLLRALFMHKVNFLVFNCPLIVFSVGGSSGNLENLSAERKLALHKYYSSFELFWMNSWIARKYFAYQDVNFEQTKWRRRILKGLIWGLK